MQEINVHTPSPHNYNIPSVFHSKNNRPSHSSQRNTNDQLADSFASTHQNKLPVNLFHSAAEYNKMLITNGRCMKKVEQPQIEGFVQSLEWINEQIFHNCQQKQKRNSVKNSNKKTLSNKGQINSFIHQCSSNKNIDKKCPLCPDTKNSSINKLFHNQKIAPVQHKIASSSNKISKHKKNVSCKNFSKDRKKKKVVASNMAMTLNINNYNMSRESNMYLSRKKFHIDDLLCQSLIKFQEEKREKKILKIREKQESLQRKSYLKIYAEEIKKFNRSQERHSQKKNIRSKSQNSKIHKGKEYWKNVKDYIASEVKKDNYEGNSKTIVEMLKNSLKQVKNCHHKSTLTPEMIQFLRKQHEANAKNKIIRDKRQKQKKKKKLESQLNRLSEWQQFYRKSCEKKPFCPSQQMIETAFQNLNEDQPKQKAGLVRKPLTNGKHKGF